MKRLAQALLVPIFASTVVLVANLPATAAATWQSLGSLSAGTGADQPQVAVDGGGNSVFVWRRSDGTTNCFGPCLRIQTRSRSAAGVLSPIQTLSASGQHGALPQVAVDAHANAVFVWQRHDGTNLRIQTRARSAAGTLSSTLTLSAAGQNASSAQVAVDPNGNAVFAWNGSDGTVQRTQARALSAAGTLSSTQTLSDPGKNAFEPRVAVDGGGNAVFIWQRFDGIDNRVQTRARSAAGTLSSTQTLAGTGTALPTRAQVAVDPQGNAVVVWERREGTAVCCMRVEARVRSANSTLGATQILSVAGQDAQEPNVAVAPNGTTLPSGKRQRTDKSTRRLARRRDPLDAAFGRDAHRYTKTWDMRARGRNSELRALARLIVGAQTSGVRNALTTSAAPAIPVSHGPSPTASMNDVLL